MVCRRMRATSQPAVYFVELHLRMDAAILINHPDLVLRCAVGAVLRSSMCGNLVGNVPLLPLFLGVEAWRMRDQGTRWRNWHGTKSRSLVVTPNLSRICISANPCVPVLRCITKTRHDFPAWAPSVIRYLYPHATSSSVVIVVFDIIGVTVNIPRDIAYRGDGENYQRIKNFPLLALL